MDHNYEGKVIGIHVYLVMVDELCCQTVYRYFGVMILQTQVYLFPAWELSSLVLLIMIKWRDGELNAKQLKRKW